MSRQGVLDVIAEFIINPSFRDSIFEAAFDALDKFDLTEKEKEAVINFCYEYLFGDDGEEEEDEEEEGGDHPLDSKGGFLSNIEEMIDRVDGLARNDVDDGDL